MALHFLADSAFDDLLTAWRHHWRIQRSERATIEELGAARAGLEDARTRMRRLRLAMYPTAEERDGALIGALCPTLDQFVYLSWSHQRGSGSRQLECPCGEAMPIPEARRVHDDVRS